MFLVKVTQSIAFTRPRFENSVFARSRLSGEADILDA